MPQQLCSVCCNISEDFWSEAYDLFESRGGIKAKLQSCKDMQKQRQRGCQLCTLLVATLTLHGMKDHEECIYLRRDYKEPGRACNLGTDAFNKSLGTLYFFRMPDIWCELPSAGLDDDFDNFHLMRTWLRNRNILCETPSNSKQFFLPTRLVDVQAFGDTGNVRLVASRDFRVDPPPAYLTLSHCWGGELPIKLESKKLKRWMRTGIALHEMPKTFRDAVRITQELAVRYLWIDSLCIIQDSPEDWACEASLMAEVYSNALCTLAALNSKDSSGGCNMVPSIQNSLDSPFVELKAELHRSLRVRIFSKMPRRWTDEYKGGSPRANQGLANPLRTRAWVLQEKELSNCTIYFAQDQLLWENKGVRATAQLPWAEIQHRASSETPGMKYVNSAQKILRDQQYPWYQLIEDYASRSLTYPSDKLVAFSGLAKAFGEGSKAQYLAGIWDTDLPAALLWQVKDSSASRPAYLAPSWSWASLMGGVSYDSLRLEPDHGSAHYECMEDTYPGLATLKLQSALVDLEHKGKPYSTVTKGRITLDGARCIKVECGRETVSFSDGGQSLFQGKVPIGVFYPDIAEDASNLREKICVALQSESIQTFQRHQFQLEQDGAMVSTVIGIVLVKDSGDDFKRIGLARWIKDSLFDEAHPTTITLV